MMANLINLSVWSPQSDISTAPNAKRDCLLKRFSKQILGHLLCEKRDGPVRSWKNRRYFSAEFSPRLYEKTTDTVDSDGNVITVPSGTCKCSNYLMSQCKAFTVQIGLQAPNRPQMSTCHMSHQTTGELQVGSMSSMTRAQFYVYIQYVS